MKGYRAIALTISTSVFMQFHDTTALNTAVPTIARALDVPVLHMDIAIIAYQIMLVVFVPVAAVLAGRWGARNSFALALLTFMCGSLLCAFAESLTMLAAARALQGVGGAVMMPLGRLILVRSAEKDEMISAMNWLLVPGMIGPILGPAVGGFIVQYASWHWIFLINVPIALLGIALTLWIVPDTREEKVERLDRTGLLLLSPFLVAMLLGLGGITGRLPVWLALSLLLAAFVFGRAYYRHARTVDAPVMDLSLLALPSLRHSLVAGTVIRSIFIAVAFLMPLWFQVAMHLSASQTGLLMLTVSIGTLASRFFSTPFLRVAHPRTLAIYGAAALAVVLLCSAGLRPAVPIPLFYALLAAQGFAMSIALMVLGPAGYVDVPPERMTAAASFNTTVQQLSMSLGVIAGVWTLTAMRWLVDATPEDNGAYSGSMVILAALAIVAVIFVRKLDPDVLGALKPRQPGV